MTRLERFFLNTNMWVLLIIFLFAPSLIGLLGPDDKFYSSHTNNSTTTFSVGNPVKNIVTTVILLTWAWTICNFFNKILYPHSDKEIKKSNTLSFYSFIVTTITSIFAYIFAEDIFQGKMLYVTISAILILSSTILYISYIWLTVKTIKTGLKTEHNNGLLFGINFLDVVFFPISTWKLQHKAKTLHFLQEHDTISTQ